MTFGSRFKARRIQMGLTQKELADEYNKRYNYSFTKSVISNYENDVHLPEIVTLRNFAEMMRVSVDYLLENDFGDNAINFKYAMMDEFKDLSPEQQDEVIKLVKTFVPYIRDKK